LKTAIGYGTGKPFRKYLVSIYNEVSGLKLYLKFTG
jgi:hypothetical protein